MNKENKEEIEATIEWTVEQLMKALDMEREDIITIIENWCEENW